MEEWKDGRLLIYDSMKKSHLIIFGCKDDMPGVSGRMGWMEGWKVGIARLAD